MGKAVWDESFVRAVQTRPNVAKRARLNSSVGVAVSIRAGMDARSGDAVLASPRTYRSTAARD